MAYVSTLFLHTLCIDLVISKKIERIYDKEKVEKISGSKGAFEVQHFCILTVISKIVKGDMENVEKISGSKAAFDVRYFCSTTLHSIMSHTVFLLLPN